MRFDIHANQSWAFWDLQRQVVEALAAFTQSEFATAFPNLPAFAPQDMGFMLS